MAINPKKASLLSLLGITCTMFILNSCTSAPKEDGVWIPLPKDTSALGRINHFIPLDQIKKFRSSFTADRDSINIKSPGTFIPNSEAFNKKILVEILKDPKCVGIRVYYGVLNTGNRDEFRLMLVGVDEQGKDLYINRKSELATQAGDGGFGGGEYGQCDPPCLK
ncbi:hypothetical protein HHL16_02020 [Pseudoflavitalea sp. G-6-1-2]|uniref:hypothetical protein n=1 Tax=Pseudoflavitalea sp. G-6-1-2 TaxID=2728841 RepID=UPI00146AD8BA|nr:hypothetical protein [Pseudoflavitalea sp. G-6-1-2]NML19627.1 hypothetical protein [Pseudoflavitalea sp. G-6-1-2]